MFPLETKMNGQRCAEHYQKALRLNREGKVDDAIFALGVAIGADPQPQPYRLLGHLYALQGAYEKAAGAHFDGRKLVEREQDLLPKCVPETIMEFLHDEALAYLRAGIWEFARMCANLALEHIEFGRASRYSTYGDSESWLRLIRMVAALQESFDFGSAHADAIWLQQNSVVEGYHTIYNAVLSGSSEDRRLPTVVLEFWKHYDVPRRSVPIEVN